MSLSDDDIKSEVTLGFAASAQLMVPELIVKEWPTPIAGDPTSCREMVFLQSSVEPGRMLNLYCSLPPDHEGRHRATLIGRHGADAVVDWAVPPEPDLDTTGRSYAEWMRNKADEARRRNGA